jgi:hypothetical protein
MRGFRPSLHSEELGVPLLEQLRLGARIPGARRRKARVVHALEGVSEHRAIDLVEDVLSDMHGQVRSDTEDVAVEGGVVDLAEGKAVGNDRCSMGLPVGDDVRRVQQLGVSETTQGAARVVGGEHPGTEHRLVQADLVDPLDVPSHLGLELSAGRDQTLALVECEGELQLPRLTGLPSSRLRSQMER